MRNGFRFGQRLIAGDVQNGIVYDIYDNECHAVLDGEIIRIHPLAAACARALATRGVHLVWSFVDERPAGFVPATPQPPIEAAPAIVPAAPVIARHSATAPARCPWHSAIRYFFGQAKGAALDTKDEAAMRGALAVFIGRDITSRSQLSAADWLLAGDAVKFGRLVW